MSLLDFSKNCDIITSSFVDDLINYSLKEDGSLQWSDNTNLDYTVRNSINLFENNGNNYWTPNFVTNDDLVDNKIISHYGPVKGDSPFDSGRIGIEDFITFTPRFKNWNVSDGNNMVIDWILNRSRTPYRIVAGLNYWKKISTPVTGSIESFPLYSKIKHNNIEYIKLDNSTLRRLTVKQNVFKDQTDPAKDSPINFNYTINDADTLVSSLGNNVTFTLVGSDTVKIWIPDGDQLLYFTNNEEESGSFGDRLDKSGTRSYVSGSLYKYYNMFYNSLTANENLVSINSSRSIKKLRRYKKLAHSLATSPFSSEFFFSFLAKPSSTIKDAINTYLDSNSNNINSDITNLTTVLNSISNEYSAYEINNNSNIVKNNNELFIKLINKYGAKLKLSNNSSVSYKSSLTHGDSILIEEIGDSLLPKTTKDTLVANNKKINLTNITLETNLGEAVSSILLKKNTISAANIQSSEVSNTVHLYDRAKPELGEVNNSINIFLLSNNGNESPENPDDLDRLRINDVNANIFYWKALGGSSTQSVFPIADNMDNWLLHYPKLGVLVLDNIIPKYKDFVAPNEIRDFLNSQFFCTWTKVSGPPMRFVDLNKTQTNKKYDIAYGHEVAIIPTSTGFYVIKCVVSSPWGTYTKFKTIVVVDGRPQIYGTNILPNFTRELVPNPGLNSIGSDNLLRMYHIENIGRDNNDPERIQFMQSRTFIDPQSIQTLYSNESKPSAIQTDNLQIAISNLDSFAIHRNGLYSPIRTNYFVERISSAGRSIEKLDTNYSFMFDKDNSGSIVPNTGNCNLRIDYICNQTIIKLDRIILRNIRNETPECSQCYSLYKPKFKSFTSRNRRPSFQRSNRFPDGFSLQKYLFDRDNIFSRSSVEEYSFPTISSDIAPPIKTYGGYGNKVLDKLTIKNISSHNVPTSANNQIVASQPFVIPSVTGYKLDYIDQYTSNADNIKKYVACYQNTVTPNGFIPFSKGAFAPNSGWVVGDSGNLSSVLKFNPGARKSFSFVGPGILNLSNYTNSDSINSSIFTSSIELTINPKIRWYDPPVNFDGVAPSDIDAVRRRSLTTHNWENQIDKELSDQLTNYTNDYHHGYRILNGGNPKLPERNLSSNSSPTNDEFDFSINEINNKFIYGFNVVGPNKPINSFSTQDITYINSSIWSGSLPASAPTSPNEPSFDEGDYIDNSTGWNLRNPRINNLTIKDIEVKLNFLNYVNTKNLVIWLEVDFIGKYASREKRAISINAGARIPPLVPFAPAQVTSSNIFVDQFIPNNTYKAFTNIQNRFSLSSEIPVNNTNIKDYLKDLTDGNSVDNIGEKLILNLLNQEIVQNKEYNFTVTFSDSANKHNTFFDQNMFSNGTIDPDQNIIHNNMKINASRHSINYNTYDNSNFSNINKNNNLNINNNTFHKFANKKLFAGVDPEEDRESNPSKPQNGGQYDASTIFTLCIAVLEEEDEMFPMDNTISNEIYTNLASVENKISSANLFNNLCSWELILHTDDVKKPVTSQVNSLANYGGADALSVIEYGEDPKYPGYGFIADLSDSKFLLPLVNMNSPTNYYQNYNSCEYADNELIGKGSLINSPRFPTEAITLILAGTAVGGMSGTLVGALVGGLGATYYLGFELLFAYYRASRTIPLLELSQRETFDIDYEGYPFGNSDKILLNISKDGVFWYKVEASIFKLSNTPALSLKEYMMIKNDSKLFKFNFSIVSNNSDIIDDIFVPYIVAKATPEITNDQPTDEELELVNSYKDINNSVYNNFNFMSVDELVFANKLINSDTNIFQYINTPNETSIIIDHSMPYYLISIGDVIRLDCEYTFATVRSKALIYKDSKYQTVLAINIPRSDLLDSGCSSFLLPEDVVVVCNGGSRDTVPLATSADYPLVGVTPEGSVDQELSSPVSLFGLVNNQPPYDSIPDLNFSTNSLGSYGDGSSVKDKNILSRKVQINTIDPIYSQLNSFNNDKHYYNELTLTLPSGNHYPIMVPTDSPDGVPSGVPIKIKTQLACYPVYYDNSTNNVINNNFYHIYNNTFNNTNAVDNTQSLRDLLDNINTSIKNNNTYYKDQPYNMMYIKGNNSVIRSLYRNVVSLITIENNYSYCGTIHRITEDELDLLKNRLDILNVTENPPLDPFIGVSSRTGSILDSNSISYIKQHYDILEPNDDNKAVTYNKLQKLYSERNEIIKLLQHQTDYRAKIFLTRADFEAETPVFIEGLILYDSLTYIQLFDRDKLDKENLYKIEYNYTLNPFAQKYHTGDGGIIPDFRAVITEHDGSISINYEKMSDNYYWINIDPKQSTSIAEECRPKILKSIKYICQSVNPAFGSVGVGAQVLDFNNICHDWRDIDGKNGTINDKDIRIKADSTGTSYIFYNHDYNLSELDDSNTSVERKSYILESRAKLNAVKNLLIPPQRGENYPETWFVNSWQEQIISRRFRINSDNSIVGLAPNQEFLVTTIETYEIALSPIEAHIKSIRGNNVNIVQSLLTNNLIKNDYSGDILKNGLLNGLDSNPDPRFDGSRNTLPNRVYNIYNLDNITELKVQFRKVPRTLRGIDAIGSVLRYGETMSYKPQSRPPLDPLDIFGVGRVESLINNFYEWKCLELNKNRDGLEEATTPDFFKLLNEMVFRSFFGSVDEIENKTPRLKSLYDFEMIPYEYFTGPQPPPANP